MLENLESRVFFAGDAVTKLTLAAPWWVTSKGTLVVGGINSATVDDNIHLIAKDGKVTINWNQLDGFRATRVKRIYVDLGGGNDKLHIDNPSNMPVTVLCGNGDDRVEVLGGPTTLMGGNGHDSLVARGEHEKLLVGGKGNDRMYGGDWSDKFIGGEGFDYAALVLVGQDVTEGVEEQFAVTSIN